MKKSRMQRGPGVRVRFLLLLFLIASDVIMGDYDTWAEQDDELVFAEESCQESLTIYGDCIERYVSGNIVDTNVVCVEERWNADMCIEDQLKFLREGPKAPPPPHPPPPPAPPPPPPPPPAAPSAAPNQHVIQENGQRLSLIRPLHWEVIPIDGTKAHIVAMVHGLSFPIPAGLHAEMQAAEIHFGIWRNKWQLAGLCPNAGDGRCLLRIEIDPATIGTVTLAMAMRLVDVEQPSVSLGPVTEITVRLQPPFKGTWTESSCWKGFFDGPPPHSSCLGDPLSRPVAQMKSSAELAAWLQGGGLSPPRALQLARQLGREAGGGEEGSKEDGAGLLLESLPPPPPLSPSSLLDSLDLTTAERETLERDAELREAWTTGPWYPLGRERGGGRGGGAQEEGEEEEEGACEGSGEEEGLRHGQVRRGRRAAEAEDACREGSGAVAMVVGLGRGAEHERALRALLTAAPPAIPALNASHAARTCAPAGARGGAPVALQRGREVLWVVAAEGASSAARLLLRHAPRFRVLNLAALDAQGQAQRAKGAGSGGRWLEEAAERAVSAQLSSALHAAVETVCVHVGSHSDQRLQALRHTLAGARGSSIEEGWACARRHQAAPALALLAPLPPLPLPAAAAATAALPVSFVLPRLYGLLGNVLWQAAAALALAADLDALRFHGRRWEVLLPEAQDPKQCAKTFQSNLLSSPSLKRRPLHTLPEHDWYYLDEGRCHICFFNLTQAALQAPAGASLLVRGWRNSFLYVQHHRRRLVEAFSLPPHLEAAAQERYQQLLSALPTDDTPTVSVHIRRGDLKQENGTMLGMSYYEEAVRRMGKDKLFIVFSDDIEDMRQEPLFRDLPHVVFVQLGIDFLEFRIMSMCDNHIIANSTFSWWAAFLHAPPSWRRRMKAGKRRKRKNNQDSKLDNEASVRASPTGSARTGKEVQVWEGTRVICPEVWGRGDTPESRFSVEELYPPEWNRVPNHLVSE